MKKLSTNFSKAKTTLLKGVVLAQSGFSLREFLPDFGFLTTDLPTFIQRILQIAFVLAGLVATIYLIWGGYQYITAGGGENAEAGKKTIINAIIGLIVIIIAFALVTFVWGRITGGEAELEQMHLP